MVARAPISEEVSISSIPWIRWFTDVSDVLTPPNWDSGEFTPVFSGLSVIDTVAVSGYYVRRGKILMFEVQIVPSGGGESASTFGTTYFTLPDLLINKNSQKTIDALGYGSMTALDLDAPADLGSGYVLIDTLNAYTPTWSSTPNQITINGWVRIEGL